MTQRKDKAAKLDLSLLYQKKKTNQGPPKKTTSAAVSNLVINMIK